MATGQDSSSVRLEIQQQRRRRATVQSAIETETVVSSFCHPVCRFLAFINSVRHRMLRAKLQNL